MYKGHCKKKQSKNKLSKEGFKNGSGHCRRRTVLLRLHRMFSRGFFQVQPSKTTTVMISCQLGPQFKLILGVLSGEFQLTQTQKSIAQTTTNFHLVGTLLPLR